MPDAQGDEAAGSWWESLSNGELRGRLVQRGVPAPVAAEWTRWRGSTFAEMIDGVLGGEE